MTTTAATTPHPVPGRPTQAPPEDLLDTLHKTGHFKHFMAAVRAAGPAVSFNTAGPHTVFAPNDTAFGKLAKGVLVDLFKPESKARLTALLRLHLVPRRVKAAVSGDAPCLLKSLQGEYLAMDTHATGPRVNDARIIQRDIEASNGVIHVIDTVLMPAAF